MSRCLDTRNDGSPGEIADADTYWKEKLEITLAPNPALSDAQRRVIAQDYEMTDGSISIPIRKALLYYFQKRLRLDVPGELDKPHEAPIVVSNRAEFDAALAEAMS